jgi:hypothetical protein
MTRTLRLLLVASFLGGVVLGVFLKGMASFPEDLYAGVTYLVAFPADILVLMY